MLYALHGHGCTPCQQTPICSLASYLRGNAGRRIPHRVFLGRRSAARHLLLRVRTANNKGRDAMGSPAGKPLMRRCTCRIEKRGTELLTGVLGSQAAPGSDGNFGDRGWLRRRSQPDRQCPCADPRERTDRGCDHDDADQRVRHGRQAFSPADRPIQVLDLDPGRQPGTAMSATRQRQPASAVDLQALRLRRMTVPSAPGYGLNVYRRAEVAVDPAAGIGLLAREFESRDRSPLADPKLDAAIARRRRNRMPWVRTKPWMRTKMQSKRHSATRRLGSRRMRWRKRANAMPHAART